MLLSYGEEDSVAPKNITSCYINDNQIYFNSFDYHHVNHYHKKNTNINNNSMLIWSVFRRDLVSIRLNHLTEERSFTPTDNILCCQLE